MSLTQFQAVELMQDHMKEIEAYKVVWTLKRLRFRPITPSSVKKMRACIAISDFGLNITAKLLADVLGYDHVKGIHGSLHNLGDKQCLTLKREDASIREKTMRWIISPNFMKYWLLCKEDATK